MIWQLLADEAARLAVRLRPTVVEIDVEARGAGAGLLYDEQLVLTNSHVVNHSNGWVDVRLHDGRWIEGELVADAPELDLALLHVEPHGLPVAPFGLSDRLRVGELVMAIGHPFGQRHTITMGVISGMGTMRLSSGDEQRYIRSDVTLGPGNSGGPLLNSGGRVVGINSMIFGGDLALAIPSDVACAWARRALHQAA